jgi:myo-inositol-1(or 4)-monophosphatase
MRQSELNTQHALEIATNAAHQAGEILRRMLPIAVVREKGQNDLVTDADIAAQSAIHGVLLQAFPEHDFVGEEDASHASTTRENRAAIPWQWVVDPLDGTTNYAHGLHNFATSIALTHHGRTVLGVVYDPMADELYSAVEGQGAWLNGKPLACSRCVELGRALVAASFPPRLHQESPEIRQFLNILVECQSIRRLGSAALNLCYVGAGRLDGYWGSRLHAWDIAAGALVAVEAGAHLCRHDGTPFDMWEGQVLAASSATLAQSMMRCIHSHWNPAQEG